nr:immunoglobulin heavy chain junction region [Macaca mulatta]MOY24584.1 immunoglobulin heavy chain junction region [Macaca mulatta]
CARSGYSLFDQW